MRLKKQKGLGLIEIMLALIITVFLVTTVVNMGSDGMAAGKIAAGIKAVRLIRTQASQYASPSDFAGMTLSNIPIKKTVGSGSGTNPWGGDYGITVNNAGTDYTLTLTLVPEEAAGPMMKVMDEDASTDSAYSGTTLTVGYDK